MHQATRPKRHGIEAVPWVKGFNRDRNDDLNGAILRGHLLMYCACSEAGKREGREEACVPTDNREP